MTAFTAILKAVDLVLAVAMKVDSALSARKQRKAEKAGLSYKDVQHIQKQIDSATSHKVK